MQQLVRDRCEQPEAQLRCICARVCTLRCGSERGKRRAEARFELLGYGYTAEWWREVDAHRRRVFFRQRAYRYAKARSERGELQLSTSRMSSTFQLELELRASCEPLAEAWNKHKQKKY